MRRAHPRVGSFALTARAKHAKPPRLRLSCSPSVLASNSVYIQHPYGQGQRKGCIVRIHRDKQKISGPGIEARFGSRGKGILGTISKNHRNCRFEDCYVSVVKTNDGASSSDWIFSEKETPVPKIIPLIKENQWASGDGKRKSDEDSALEKRSSEPSKTARTIDELAAEAVLADAQGGFSREESSKLVLPLLVQNRVPGIETLQNETEKFRHDLNLRPEQVRRRRFFCSFLY